MSNNRVTRGEKIMDQLVNADIITPSGKDWLVAAFDPFHDHQLKNLQGWPDVETGASVVRCIKQSVTVGVPGFIKAAGDDTWDLHIVQWPFLTQSTGGGSYFISTTTRDENTFSADIGSSVFAHIGGLQLYACRPGDNLDLMPSSTCQSVAFLEIDPALTQGSGRLLGMGFEVYNTTSQLNVQGTVLTYRQMANPPQPSTWIGGDDSDPTHGYIFSAYTLRHPPVNATEAMLLAGTRQWEAKDGCYVVAAFHSEENPAFTIDGNTVVISYPDNDDQDASVNNSNMYVPKPNGGPGIINNPVRQRRVHPIHQAGAIFTGLSLPTTLTINWNVYYESFPGPAESAILPLATPSCEYDPAALDFYSRVMIDLPVGVMVKENGLGDWFLDAASTAASYVAPLLEGSGNPLAMGAGAVLDYLGKTGKDYVKKNKPEAQAVIEAPSPAADGKVVRPAGQGQSRSARRRRVQAKKSVQPSAPLKKNQKAKK